MILDSTFAAATSRAADALAAGQLLGLPTETVYGLAADAGNDTAVRAIFAAKGRPAEHPLIVHVASAAQVADFAADVPAFAQQLIDAFWPGPLTLILPRRAGVAEAAAGGHATIGLRCPAHPVAQDVLAACAGRGVRGLAAPSANRFGRVSPTTAQHVADEFGDELLVLDGGPCGVGIESTIVDCTRGQPVLLRPGAITPDMVAQRLGLRVLTEQAAPQDDAPRAPGTLASHYAPRAKVRIMGAKDMQAALDLLGTEAPPIGVWSRTALRSAAPQVQIRRMPDDAGAAAQQLFAQLRAFDALGVGLIWIEPVPLTPDWAGVADRLQRAAA